MSNFLYWVSRHQPNLRVFIASKRAVQGVGAYIRGGLKRSTQHPARRESVKRKPKKAKAKRRGRSALICMSLQYNELRNCD